MSAFFLKLIAVTTMFIDHLGVALRLSGLLSGAGTVYKVMRIVGRIAFPIYGLMVAEGVIYTRSRPRYFLRLLMFAILSELPFDLALRGRLAVWDHQNVYFTLMLGMIIMSVIAWGSRLPGWKKIPGLGLAAVLAAGFAYASRKWLHLDYQAAGIVMLTVIGILVMPLEELRSRIPWENFLRCFFVAAAVIAMTPLTSSSEYYALLALIPIYFYNGKKGYTSEVIKYAFYAFYPLHLLILWLAFVLPNRGFRF